MCEAVLPWRDSGEDERTAAVRCRHRFAGIEHVGVLRHEPQAPHRQHVGRTVERPRHADGANRTELKVDPFALLAGPNGDGNGFEQ